MTPLTGTSSRSVEQLLEAVARLSPAEQREFQRRLSAGQATNGSSGPDEAALVQAAQARLPAAEDRRLRRLMARSERGQLTPQELSDYQSLAQEAQRIDALRIEALATLAQRRGQSVQAVKAALDRQGRKHGA